MEPRAAINFLGWVTDGNSSDVKNLFKIFILTQNRSKKFFATFYQLKHF